MPAITPAISRTFVGSVRLPPPPRRAGLPADSPPVELRDLNAQALVVGSGLIAAADKVPAATREDLVSCTLFAQLAATAAVGDQSDVGAWYRAYFGTLAALGWAQSDTRFERYEFTGHNAEAHQAVLKVLTALLGPQAAALAIVRAAIDALQSMAENRPWLALFERESKAAKSARFQVATAHVDSSDLVEIALAGFSLGTKSDLTQVLFFKFTSSSTSLDYAAGKATIYDAALADLRPTIEGRLTEYRHALVGEIKLPASAGSLLGEPHAARPGESAHASLLGLPDAAPAHPHAKLVRALLS
jgi:hypothetical protein